MKYTITYSGCTDLVVEADSPEEAEAKFNDDYLSELNDYVIEDIQESGLTA